MNQTNPLLSLSLSSLPLPPLFFLLPVYRSSVFNPCVASLVLNTKGKKRERKGAHVSTRVHIRVYVREYFCPLPLGPPSWSSCAILFTIQLSVNSPRAERAFCLARHSSSRSNARGPLWITPTDVSPPVFSSLFFFFLLLFHSLRPFCWKKERLRYIGGTTLQRAHEFLREITYYDRVVCVYVESDSFKE